VLLADIAVNEILAKHFPERDWTLRKASEGMSSKGYVATGDGLELFVKLEEHVGAVRRAAELGIAPRVLAAGSHNGTPYFVQEYLHGTHPDRPWFSRHLPQLADLILRYHNDPALAALFGKEEAPGYVEYIGTELGDLQAQLSGLPESSYKAELSPLLNELKAQARHLEPAGLVPTHADPNNNNFLLVGERIYLLDWDRASLSDPYRDVGPLLWWYVPEEQWPEFFAAFSPDVEGQAARKVYWWAAWHSCMVALWFARLGYPEFGQPFVVDFAAALHGQANPHA
jgi:aminoglycoside phosphotransferase (APT) family kinase protein